MTSVANDSGLEKMPEQAQCLKCGYSLRGLVVARCPEWGRGFDPGDAKSYVTSPMLGWAGSVALVTVGLVNAFIIVGGALLELSALFDLL